jgi:hypothetical protein
MGALIGLRGVIREAEVGSYLAAYYSDRGVVYRGGLSDYLSSLSLVYRASSESDCGRVIS